MYVLEWRTVSALTRGLFWCLYPELRSNEGNKYQYNTRVSAEKVRYESAYIISFLTKHNEFINDDKTTIFTLRPRVLLARSSFCWWHHNGLLMTSQWLDNCYAITWIVISNSLDIDYIHGDIHDRSCKKLACRIVYTSHFQCGFVVIGSIVGLALEYRDKIDIYWTTTTKKHNMNVSIFPRM